MSDKHSISVLRDKLVQRLLDNNVIQHINNTCSIGERKKFSDLCRTSSSCLQLLDTDK